MHLPLPSKPQIAALEPLNRLDLGEIAVVSCAADADQALQQLSQVPVLGFDTESKPTFFKDQISEGPHVVQFSTPQRAWVFQLHDARCRQVVCTLLTQADVAKVGFGLAGDHQQIRRTLQVEPVNVLDLNQVFRKRGYAREIGVKMAVALLFNKRLLKSGKATTSNWANRQLSPAQVIYAANDAWAAILVYHALGLGQQSPANGCPERLPA